MHIFGALATRAAAKVFSLDESDLEAAGDGIEGSGGPSAVDNHVIFVSRRYGTSLKCGELERRSSLKDPSAP